MCAILLDLEFDEGKILNPKRRQLNFPVGRPERVSVEPGNPGPGREALD
jgi:hypothetical protein